MGSPSHPRQRARLLNAVVYFASRTSHCGSAKLFRLLYLLDVHHFQTTGVVATGEPYAAYDFGPAPVDLFDVLPHGAWRTSELGSALIDHPDQSVDFGQVRWTARAEKFDDDAFTPLQLEVMANLAHRFAFAHYREVDVSADNGAWQATWFHGRGKGSIIPMELTLRSDDPRTAQILELHEEEQARLAGRRRPRGPVGYAAQRR
jgi:hypothetical protein